MQVKKGFTLIELLGVILLLGIIAVIGTTLANRVITSSKKSLAKTQEETLISAAKKWSIQNNGKIPMENGDSTKVTFTELADEGYIDSDDLIDPRVKGNGKICGYIRITYLDRNNQYNYELVSESCKSNKEDSEISD